MAENSATEVDVSSDEEIEEPKLKYERLSNDVLTILSKDSASCIAVNDKLVVIGSHWGKLYVLDHKGNNVSNKEVQAHAVSVNQISLDSKGDYVASCSDDGRVIVYGLYSSDNAHTLSFEKPIKSVALDPEYYRPNSRRRFLIGDDKLTLYEKTFLRGHKSTILHSGEGLVSNIKWSGRYIAWATDVGVRVFDILDNCTISLIKKDCVDRNLDYKCHLCWSSDNILLIGWGDTMKTCQIRRRPNNNQNYNLPVQYVEITKMAKSDFYICGIGPIDNHVAVLCLPKSSNEEHPRPQLKVLEMFLKEYSDISTDILSIRGHTEYSVKDYHLECLCNEGLFFIVSPKDIVVAKPRDSDDHIDWLLEMQKYEEALIAATRDKGKTLQRHTVVDVGRKYIQILLSAEEYEKAARLCVQVLGKEKPLWETEVYRFAHLNQLRTLSPYLPRGDFHLSSAIYEMVLFEFLKLDSEGFLNTVKEWSPKLYSVSGLVNALLEELLAQPDNEVLLQALAQLYSYQNKHDKALAIYLKLGHKDVFELIHKHRLLPSIHDKLEGLMMLDLEQAVKLYLEHIDLIPVPLVVSKLKNNPKFLFAYLDALVAKDSKGTVSGKYHGLLVGLYAVQAPQRLLAFLQSSSSYPLQGALEVCQQHSLHHECVYLLARMGNTRNALRLITEELGDIYQGVDFCKEHNDPELWEDLITCSLTRPDFLVVLLSNVGTYVDPSLIVRRIRLDMVIPGLRDALVKILQDYQLQIALKEGCQRIIVSDCFALQKKLVQQQNRSILITDSQVCSGCQGEVTNKDHRNVENVVVFHCHHVFHEKCLPETKATLTCTICNHQKKYLFQP